MEKLALVISVGKTNSLELNHDQNEFALLLKEIGYDVLVFFSQDIDTIDILREKREYFKTHFL